MSKSNKYLIEFPENPKLNSIFNLVSDCLNLAESNEAAVSYAYIYKLRTFTFPSKALYGIYKKTYVNKNKWKSDWYWKWYIRTN